MICCLKTKGTNVMKNEQNSQSFQKKDPLLTVVRIRQNAVNEMFTPLKPNDNTIFQKSLKLSKYTKIEFLVMSCLSHFNTNNFFDAINEIIESANGKYVYFCTDNIILNKLFFSFSIDFLEKNIEFDGILTPANILSKQNDVIETFGLEIKKTGLDVVFKLHDFVKVISELLPLYFWRKVSLCNFISDFPKFNSFDRVFFEFYQKSFNQLKICYLSNPCIGIYKPITGKDYFREGLDQLNNNKLSDALCFLDKAKVLDENIPDLNYYRALIKCKIGDFYSARLAAEVQLNLYPSDSKSVQLLSEIMSVLGTSDIKYENVSANLDTIDSQISIDQKKYLFNKVKSLKNNAVILEIGSRFGSSTASLAYACIGTKKRIFCIDTFGCISQNWQDIWKSNMLRLDLENFVSPLPGYSHEQLKKWGDKPKIDFVFLDASHLYKDTLLEFELLYPLVNNGGWMAFHDVEPAWPGSWRVWRETAMPILSSHEYSSTLACGKKEPGRKLVQHKINNEFFYSKEWVKYLFEIDRKLAKAMELSIKMYGRPDCKNGMVLQSEQVIAEMSTKFKKELRVMLKEEASSDPFLHFWNGLTQLKDNDVENAKLSFYESHRLSNLINTKIEALCRDGCST